MRTPSFSFTPYTDYRENQRSISDFVMLTTASYGIAQQLLFKHPDIESPRIELHTLEDVSFSEADIEEANVDLGCGWISFSDYAQRTQQTEEIVARDAAEGKLGRVDVHPETHQEMIIWPPDKQTALSNELPLMGHNKYTVTMRLQASLSLDTKEASSFEETQRTFLSFAHSIGEPDQAAQRAEEMLYRSCFILQWTTFETFMRQTVSALLKRHPEVVIRSKRPPESLSFETLLATTTIFRNLEDFRADFIRSEIQRQIEGKSVSELINMLKKEFSFSQDPYQSPYVFHGRRLATHYNDLIQFKDVRNALMHDGGIPEEKFFNLYPHIFQRDGSIVIQEDYYHRYRLCLASIAFTIAKAIGDGTYIVANR